ncbi:ATP-binding protein [candidate division WOR-3 bacterium]|jgi:ATP-dependent 26S proteasome regulatory subunit|nr:ATP-binding protein [candidate division WOR-3 bacterium]
MEQIKEVNRQYLKTLSMLLQAKYPDTVVKEIFRSDKDFQLLHDFKEEPKSAVNGKLKSGKKDAKVYEKELKRIVHRAEKKGIMIPLEKIAAENGLEPLEKELLMMLFFAQFSNRNKVEGRELLKWLSADALEMMDNMRLLLPGSRLRKNGLIVASRSWRAADGFVLEQEFRIPDRIFYEICGVQVEKEPVEVKEKELEIEEERIVNLLSVREPEVSFDQLALPEPTLRQIEQALWQYQNQGSVFNDYGIAAKIPYGKGTTMLFYGPPGTGKTATAAAIARALNKKLGVVNYPSIYSRYVGDSEKNIKQVFDEAKEADCVLVFDEADACFGVRVEERQAVDRSFNLMTNILMQEVERFDGIVILTTNRDFAFDPAFDRRFLYKLKFDLPDETQRAQIWQILLKDCAKMSPDVSFAELARRYPLSGGKIKNAVMKAVMKCARENRLVTMLDLQTAAEEELGQREEKRIGFLLGE